MLTIASVTGRIAELFGTVQYRHLVVVLQYAVAESLEDPADPAHPEGVELGGAQRAHAGGAVDMDALGHRPQDLLVPDRRHHLEIAVDDADDAGRANAAAVHFALPHRRPPSSAGSDGRSVGGSDGPAKMTAFIGIARRRARARGPASIIRMP